MEEKSRPQRLNEDSMIGSVIKDTYRIDRYLGEGGPSIVYQGTDLLLSAPVAIKRLKLQASLGDGSSMAERFLREARTHARLIHQNIVGIRAVLEENNEFFIVMEFVDGGDLAQLLKRYPNQQLSVNDAIALFGQALLGLDYAHRNKVIHRDIKPSNILVNQEQCAKIADFGLARAVTDHKITGAGFLVGTLSYMSPEQLQGNEAKPTSDIYSLGVSLYEALAGHHPFVRNGEKPTPQEIFGRHMFDAPPLLSTLREDISLSLAEVVNRSIAKDPLERYPNCISFAEALQKSAEGFDSSQSGGHLALALSMQSGVNRSPESSSSNGGSAERLSSPPPSGQADGGTGAFVGREQTPLRPPASVPPSHALASGEPSLPPTARKGTREVQRHESIPLRPPAGFDSSNPMPSGETIYDHRSPVPRSWSPQDSATSAGEHPVPGSVGGGASVHSEEKPWPGTSNAQPEVTQVVSSEESFPPPRERAEPSRVEDIPDTWKETVSPLPRKEEETSSSGRGFWMILVLLLAGGVGGYLYRAELGFLPPDGASAQAADGGSSDYWPLTSSAAGVPTGPGAKGSNQASKAPDTSASQGRPSPPLASLASFRKICASKPGHMVFIPPGSFVRGRTANLNKHRKLADAPSQRVQVSGFCMDRYEVTVGDYKRCVEKGFCISIPWSQRWRWKKKRYKGLTVAQVLPMEQPMRYVRWQDAQLYCRWARKRLPTEAEWEWAARGDDGWRFPWGNQRPICDRAVSKSCKGAGPQAVNERRKLGSNPFGVFDLSGNVAEWVRDCYDPKGYDKLRKQNPTLQDPLFDTIPCKQRVLRGGSFRHKGFDIRSYVRMKRRPQHATRWIGFRCVASVRRK
ncbi:MAG: hypothetical protein EP343_08050 [Deltaproteobacteria bacterium]|nr:MAG: hypothetical protein EP343_08050 [Deltaproteobacteria bacterium]